jgi:hypothetical protein
MLALEKKPPLAPAPVLRCPHCGGVQVFDQNPGQSWKDGEARFSLLRCLDCKGMFTYPPPPPALLERLYTQEYDYGWFRDHLPAKHIDALHRVWQYYRHGLLTGKRILDFGGGMGYFARAARLCGYDAVTLDPFYDRARGVTSPEALRQYEVVTSHHVLEHASDPGEMVDTLRGLLSPSGTLLLCVPNAEAAGYKQRGTDWAWCQPPFIHVHHFTAKGLRALLARHGLRVDKELYFERWDANALSDLRLVRLYMKLEAMRARSKVPFLNAQLTSFMRFLSLLGTYYWPAVPETERAELMVVARHA